MYHQLETSGVGFATHCDAGSKREKTAARCRLGADRWDLSGFFASARRNQKVGGSHSWLDRWQVARTGEKVGRTEGDKKCLRTTAFS